MNSGLRLIKIFLLVVLSVICVFVWAIPNKDTAVFLTVSFLDVGQGDAIHIMTPDGFEVLIDGGSSASILRQLASTRSFFDRKIDLLIATHPDTDHVGGLVDVLDRYQVANIMMTNVNHKSAAAEAFNRGALLEPEASLLEARAGQIINLGASTSIRILSPQGNVENWSSNNASIVLQLVYGDIEFMLTGDAPNTIENYLVDIYGNSIASEVLKLGHHGSKTSTAQEFLEIVAPDFAVVSAGQSNRYGHPSEEVVNRVSQFGATIISTANWGNIVFQSDGNEVWVVE